MKFVVALFLMAALFTTGELFSQQLVGHPDEAYENIAEEIITAALTEQKGYKILGELCQIGPRLSGSENSMKAIRWAEAKMKELGFDRVILQPVMVPHWVRGDVELAEIVEPAALKGRQLAVTALGGSVGTPEGGLTAGVLEVFTFEELARKSAQARGKIVFFNRPFPQHLVNTFAGYGATVGQRVHGPSEAAGHGAVAALVRSVGTAYDNSPHTGSLRYREDAPRIPAAAVGVIDADFLSQALKQYPGLKVRLKLSCQNLPDVQSYNVIGDLIGSTYPDEYVLVSGHFDSWDKGDGAHDDGGGCIQALEVLDLLKRLGIQPKRTIRCVFFINEENGLRGARAYARMADSLGLKHVAAIESDRGSFSPRGFSVSADSTVIAAMQRWLPILRKAGIEWIRPGGSGADVSQIKGAIARIGFVPDGQRYFDYHHSDNDVYEAVHPREFELGAAAQAILAYLISEEGLYIPRGSQ
ncbi:MAG: M20/M25/M40 family metallo-hydrolase [Calditrichaeota bacterium]|nr:MAG: M20/M25/M40 family metallo-hydrolase [Calditrichota bacterium]